VANGCAAAAGTASAMPSKIQSEGARRMIASDFALKEV
jgi:hypothetical protein